MFMQSFSLGKNILTLSSNECKPQDVDITRLMSNCEIAPTTIQISALHFPAIMKNNHSGGNLALANVPMVRSR